MREEGGGSAEGHPEDPAQQPRGLPSRGFSRRADQRRGYKNFENKFWRLEINIGLIFKIW